MDKLAFAVDKYKLTEVNDSQLMELEVYLVSSGQNSHRMPIPKSAIKNAAFSLVGKPILYKYSQKNADFMSHEEDEIACGCVISDKDIRFETDDDDKLWLICKGYIWKHYYPEVVEVFERDEEKSVSMEIQVVETTELEDGCKEITTFLFLGFTLLGSLHKPAIDSANAKVLKFEDLLQETEKMVYASHPLEEFLDTNGQDIDLTKVNNTGTIGKNLALENNKISKEDEGMNFNKEEFAKTCGLTANEMSEMLYLACGAVKYTNGEYESTRYYMRDYTSDFVFAYDYMESKVKAIPYSFADGEVSMDFENAKSARMTYVIEGEDDGEDVLLELLKKLMSEKEAKFAEEKVALEKCAEDEKVKYSEMETKFSTLEAEMTSTKETFATLETENTSLKEFKANVEKQAKDNEIEFAIREVADDIGATKVDEWRSKANEYETVEAFSNAIKSFAYEMSKGKKGKVSKEEISRISLTANAEPNKVEDGDVWSKLKNKIK